MCKILKREMRTVQHEEEKGGGYKGGSSIASREKHLNRNSLVHAPTSNAVFQYALACRARASTTCQGERRRIIYCAVTTCDIGRPLFTVSLRTIRRRLVSVKHVFRWVGSVLNIDNADRTYATNLYNRPI